MTPELSPVTRQLSIHLTPPYLSGMRPTPLKYTGGEFVKSALNPPSKDSHPYLTAGRRPRLRLLRLIKRRLQGRHRHANQAELPPRR